METKTEKATKLYKAGQLKEALAIFKTFKLGITKAQKDILTITHECLAGYSSFYSTMGHNVLELEEEAKQIIENNLIKK